MLRDGDHRRVYPGRCHLQQRQRDDHLDYRTWPAKTTSVQCSGSGIKQSALPPSPLMTAASLAQWLRRPPRERKIRGSIPPRAVSIFPGRVIPVTSKLVLQWLPCQALGVIGSALGLVGPESVTG